MNHPWKLILFWTPRALCVLFAPFLSIFALDVFDEGFGFWKTIVALFMHLIPTWIVLAVLAISWRWGLMGTLLCSALGAFYVIYFWGRFHWSAYVLISGPLFLISALFLIDWLSRPGSGRTERAGSLSVVPAPEDKAAIDAAEPEGGAQDGLDPSGSRSLCDMVQVEIRIGAVMDCGRNDLLLQNLHAGGGLDRRGSAKAVADRALDRAHRKLPGVAAEDLLDGSGLDQVIDHGACAMGVVVVDLVGTHTGRFEGRRHAPGDGREMGK